MGYLPYDVSIKVTLWIIVMIYLIVIGTYFVIKALKIPEAVKSRKSMLFANALFFYLYVITRIFYTFSDYERDANNLSLLYYQYLALAHIFIILALIFVIFLTEKYVINRTKYIMTCIFLIFLSINILIIFNPSLMPIIRNINLIVMYSEVILLLLLYLYLAIVTSGTARKKSFIVFLAFFVMIVGTLLELDILNTGGIILLYYTPIVFGIGATIYAYGQNIEIS